MEQPFGLLLLEEEMPEQGPPPVCVCAILHPYLKEIHHNQDGDEQASTWDGLWLQQTG